MAKPDSKKIMAELERELAQGIALATANIDADLKDGSPVDTGRFRVSWFHVEGTNADTDAVAPAGQSSYPAPAKLDANDINGTKDQRILNNLPYAQRLCLDGWSKKVPSDWFTRIGQRVQDGAYLTEAFRSLGFK